MRSVPLFAGVLVFGAVLSGSDAATAKAKTKVTSKAKAKQPLLAGSQGYALNGELRDVFSELQSVAQLTGKVASTMGELMQTNQQGAFQQQQQTPSAPQAPPAPMAYLTAQNMVDPTVGATSLIGTPLIEDLPPQDMTGKYELPASAQPLTNPPTTTTTTAEPSVVPPELAFLLPPTPPQPPPQMETPQQIQAREQAEADSVARQLRAMVPSAQMTLERIDRQNPEPARPEVQRKAPSQPAESGLWRAPANSRPQTPLISGAQVAGMLSNSSIAALFHNRRAPTWTLLSRHINTEGMFSMYKQKMAELKSNREGNFEQSRKDDDADDDDDSESDDAPSPPAHHALESSEDIPFPVPVTRSFDHPPTDPKEALEQLVMKTDMQGLPDYSSDLQHKGQVSLSQQGEHASHDDEDKDDDDTPEQQQNLYDLERSNSPSPPAEAPSSQTRASLLQIPQRNTFSDEVAVLEKGSSLWRPGYPQPQQRPLPSGNVFSEYQKRLQVMSQQQGAAPPSFMKQSPIFQTYQRRMQQEQLKQREEESAPRSSEAVHGFRSQQTFEERAQPFQGVANLFDGGIAAHAQKPGVPPTRMGMAQNALRRNLFAPNLFDSYRQSLQRHMQPESPPAPAVEQLPAMPTLDTSRVSALWSSKPEVSYSQQSSLRAADAALGSSSSSSSSLSPVGQPADQADGLDFSGDGHRAAGLSFGTTSSGSFGDTWKPLEQQPQRPTDAGVVQRNSPLRNSVYDLYMQRLGQNHVPQRHSAGGGSGVNVMADYRRRLAALQEQHQQEASLTQKAAPPLPTFSSQLLHATQLQQPQAHLLAELSGA